MFDLEVDYEAVRELLIEMAEDFDTLGYNKVLEDFEGSGRIGKAVANPRDSQAVQVITLYMKGIAKELLSEEAALVKKVQQAPYLKENPQFKQACAVVLQAKNCLEETFQELKKCFKEPELAKPLARNQMPAPRPAPALAPAAMPPQRARAMPVGPAPRMLPPAARIAPGQRTR
jgi:hypothetical protein